MKKGMVIYMAPERLKQFRELLTRYGIDAFVITDSDPHSSEYPADHWKARSWLSGFTGSNGTLVVMHGEAALWTDGRYYIQAENQLAGSGIALMRSGEPGTPAYPEWIAGKLTDSSVVGINGRVFSCADFNELEDALCNIGAKIVIDRDLVGEIWTEGRPELPGGPVFLHDTRYAGKPASMKLEEVAVELKRRGAAHTLICGLEDVAWLYNIRGADIRNLPVAYACAFVSISAPTPGGSPAILPAISAYLFIDPMKVPAEVARELSVQGVCVSDTADLNVMLEQLGTGGKICCDSHKLSKWLQSQIPGNVEIIYKDEPTLLLKAIKNDAEVRGHRECQIWDGAAMVRFMMWIEREVSAGVDLSERDAVVELSRLRSLCDKNRGDSFSTIAGYGPHGAMMHYNTGTGAGAKLKNKGLMVVDSGGQYPGGTTDVTRTIVFGETTPEERRDFTLTLKSHIALASARILYGATGSHIDSIARKVMWDHGMDYKCGTGHGIGSYLSVHEGPQSISMRAGAGVRLEENMIVSIEPGVYREGKHGVRIENLARLEEDFVNEFGRFLRFEILSFCPISLDGIEAEMLNADERKWLNDYHRAVYDKISVILNEDERKWLANATRAI